MSKFMAVAVSAEERPAPKRAVLVDQHPLFLEGMERVLAGINVEVVGKAGSAEQALALVVEQEPDLLVTEVPLDGPDMDGISCVREARALVGHLEAVAVSTLDDPQWVSAAFEAGAKAYVLKTARPDDLAVAVRQTFTQSVYVAPGPGNSSRQPADGSQSLQDLTRREVEILRHVAEGHSNAELARMLWVTEQTVKFHLGNIYRKLQVANRTEASRWAQLNGLLDQPPASGELRNGERTSRRVA